MSKKTTTFLKIDFKGSGLFFALTLGLCVLPSLFNLFKIDFGSKVHVVDYSSLAGLPSNIQENRIVELLNGRFIQVILVAFSIPIAFLTIILAFVDYRIKKDFSTPIVGVALFCAGLLDIFYMLTVAGLIPLEGDQNIISEFTWLISRTFHALILILGTGIFLLFFSKNEEKNQSLSENLIFYISAIFILLSLLTINVLLSLKTVPELYYPNFFISRPFDTIPIILYILSGAFVFPAFYKQYPSIFSQTLILSLIPAIFSQIHMALSSNPLQDNHFNIAHFLQIVTYLIPFLGLSLNYLQTHRNELQMITVLDYEIRERTIAEELIRGIYNSSVNGIMAFQSIDSYSEDEKEYTLLTFNTSSIEILQPISPITSKMSLLEVFDEEISHKIKFNIRTLSGSQNSKSWESFELRIQKWIQLTLVKLGEGFVITFADITQKRQTERQLLLSEKLALTGRFARTIAHEVRNPLTNITLSMGQLKSEVESTDASLNLYFDIVRRNCERINQLITELLNSTRPDEFKFVEYSASDLINESIGLANDRIQLKEIWLIKNLNHKIDTIWVDPVKMKIALLNILINAIEAMSPGSGQLIIQTSDKENQILIQIKDNGIGIPEENLGQLFEPFFTGKIKGTGLGLTSTQNIIHNHNGHILVESTLGKGTEFLISLNNSI